MKKIIGQWIVLYSNKDGFWYGGRWSYSFDNNYERIKQLALAIHHGAEGLLEPDFDCTVVEKWPAKVKVQNENNYFV